MKKLMSLAFSLLLITGAYAGINSGIENALSTENYTVNLADDDQRTEVKLAELPQAVQDALDGDDYKGWEADQTAYFVKEKATMLEYYEITLKNSESGKTKVVKLTKTGEKVK